MLDARTLSCESLLLLWRQNTSSDTFNQHVTSYRDHSGRSRIHQTPPQAKWAETQLLFPFLHCPFTQLTLFFSTIFVSTLIWQRAAAERVCLFHTWFTAWQVRVPARSNKRCRETLFIVVYWFFFPVAFTSNTYIMPSRFPANQQGKVRKRGRRLKYPVCLCLASTVVFRLYPMTLWELLINLIIHCIKNEKT